MSAWKEELNTSLYYQSWKIPFSKLIVSAATPLIFSLSYPAQSQVIPDSSLPVNSQTAADCSSCVITGGTALGGNLFHSFSSFSVPFGGAAYFNNAAGVQNIITRVTGTSISTIDGLIRANGSASLFLLNPNGIVFGTNARLAIEGSFVASTADRVIFTDSSVFRVSRVDSSPPLLTVTAPIGLGIEHPGATITVLGTGHSLRVQNPLFSPVLGAGQSTTGLRVPQGRSISLVSGTINLSGGILTAPSGLISLSGVESGEVHFSSNLQSFDLSKAQQFGQINLLQKSLVDTSGQGGQIQIMGNRVALQDGSAAIIQNQGLLNNGMLQVNAVESITLSGSDQATQFPTRLLNETGGRGDAGSVVVTAPIVEFTQGSQITTRTYTDRRGGDILINARRSFRGDGIADTNPALFSFVIAGTGGSGRSGDVFVTSPSVEIFNGAGVGSVTLASGNAGDVSVRSNSINLAGETSAGFSSALFSSTGGTGNAGRVDIETATLRMSDGANISSSTGAQGNANSINIQASDLVDIRGVSRSNPGFLTGLSSSANSQTSFLRRLLNLPATNLGDAGSISLSTQTLMLLEGGAISVLKQGSGSAGSINIDADLIRVRQGQISAASDGSGGSINIKANSLQIISDLKLSLPPSAFTPVPFTYSRITAGSLENGSGGNVLIQTQTFLSINGFLRATAQGGSGGQIKVTAQGSFISRDSIISATSALGPQFDGQVQFNAPEVDLTRAAFPLVAVTDPPPIASVCGTQTAQQSSFIQSGTGGLAKSPEQSLLSQEGWHRAGSSTQSLEPLKQPAIIEAQSLVAQPDGSMELVVDARGSGSPSSYTSSCLLNTPASRAAIPSP